MPFVNQKEYKDKERELQKFIKKYDIEIHPKKQKKFKRVALDYKNKTFYKWQAEIEELIEELDDTSMDESPSEEIEVLDGATHLN